LEESCTTFEAAALEVLPWLTVDAAFGLLPLVEGVDLDESLRQRLESCSNGRRELLE